MGRRLLTAFPAVILCIVALLLFLPDARKRLRSFLRKLPDNVCNQSRPARLVRRAAAATVVSVEILVKKDVIFEMRVGLKFSVGSKNRSSSIRAALK